MRNVKLVKVYFGTEGVPPERTLVAGGEHQVSVPVPPPLGWALCNCGHVVWEEGLAGNQDSRGDGSAGDDG